MKITIKIQQPKPRGWEPIKRAAYFGDKRVKRIRTRGEQLKRAIKESVE